MTIYKSKYKKMLLSLLFIFSVALPLNADQVSAINPVNLQSFSENHKNLKFYGLNKSELLIDQEEIMPAVLDLLERAEHKIQISTYLFGGKTGHQISEKLVSKKKQGVEIEFLADPTMGDLPMMVSAALKEYNYLEENGVDVKYFPLDMLPKGSLPFSNVRCINHNKMIVIDQKEAILGGMNFLDSEIVNRDYMLQIKGPAAGVLSKIADRSWNLAENKDNIRYINYESEKIITSPLKVSNLEIAQTGFVEQSIVNMIIDHIDNAKKSIKMEMLLVDHAGIIQALNRAKKRGLDIKIILEKISYDKYYNVTDPFQGILNFNAVSAFKEAGINVKWFVPYKKMQIMHGKMILIDDKSLIVGSANLTYPALYRNHEISVTVKEKSVVEKFKNAFEDDWKKHTENVSLSTIDNLIAASMGNFQETIFLTLENKGYKF